MNVVIDTNVLISAVLIKNSISDQVFTKAIQSYRILVSTETLAELTNKLLNPKFNKYVGIEKRIRFLQLFENIAFFVEPKQFIVDCRDPKDNRFLELAIEGNASFIISGDKDLIVLNPYRNIPIITPKEFFETYKNERQTNVY